LKPSGVLLMGCPPDVESLCRSMSDFAVTSDAAFVVVRCVLMRQNATHQPLMAADAVADQNAFIVRTDADRLVKILKGEFLRVREPVLSLDEILHNSGMWKVAVVASCDRVVRTFQPAVIGGAHDVAIHAGSGIVREIGVASGVNKRVAADADQNAEHRDDKAHSEATNG